MQTLVCLNRGTIDHCSWNIVFCETL